ncbi:ACP synthase [Candidatus Bathyarchaeota archaeon]|nr:MAG: ACP synthase [Candidatus Bathyarchaeota archaeon ex4484_40]RJS67604.1 MAG: holo-ACP synthase [Candidatus Bathyarchaeota archaeon]RLG96090.1 MAG: ACP synthase [Candidatus Bathyarchaeota archaeon]
MIVGIGVDLVRIERMRAAVSRRTERFLKRIFTQQEIEDCYREKDPFPHLSARFAAKEAVLKAFGLGWGRGIKWTDIEITKDEWGAPRVNFFGLLKEKAKEKRVKQVMLSLSHEGQYAIAFVLLTGGV